MAIIDALSASVIAINRELDRAQRAAESIADPATWQASDTENAGAAANGPSAPVASDEVVISSTVDLMLAQHAVTANLNVLRTRLGFEHSLIDLLA